jgi:hypothetical protein
VSPNEAGESNTLSVNTVLINPETERHSRHQFEGKNRTARDTTIEVGIAVLECSNHQCIFDACLNRTDGAAATLGGGNQFDAVQVGADLGEGDDGHG